MCPNFGLAPQARLRRAGSVDKVTDYQAAGFFGSQLRQRQGGHEQVHGHWQPIVWQSIQLGVLNH